MKRDVRIQTEPIDEVALIRSHERSDQVGAVTRFLGVVRRKEGESDISAIDYEAFESMAYHQFDLILNEIEARWPIEAISIVHLVGEVPVNQPSLWVECAASHRKESFEAIQYLIDEMKQRVTIWKNPIESQTATG